MTAHKSQGQTIQKAIIDLATCHGTEPPYVMVSRPSEDEIALNEIAIMMRKFPPQELDDILGMNFITRQSETPPDERPSKRRKLRNSVPFKRGCSVKSLPAMSPYDLITDDSRVKDVFMLKKPTNAPQQLAHLYDYQVTVLNSIHVDDEENEAESGQTNVDAMEWIRHSNPTDAPDLGPERKPNSENKGHCAQRSETPINVHNDTSTPIIPQRDEIKLNALYDRCLLYDYGGTLFDQHHAKLVQRNITDATGALIPPWEEYDNLHTGSIVLARVSLKLYCIQTGSKTRKEKPDEDRDSDDDLLKDFSTVFEPTNSASSYATSAFSLSV
ncbi:hypothetical protein BGY98DRAFT_938417 [Russula aff. rugulosa BPL654]|nr:hypothetical protein BGY98DRAFT_938417 [Russula aff. rugulosa BPL654]